MVMAMMNVPVSCLSRADSRPRTSAADASRMAAASYLHDSGFKTFKPFKPFQPNNMGLIRLRHEVGADPSCGGLWRTKRFETIGTFGTIGTSNYS